MKLDGLNPTNTFERKLLDVLVAMARDGTPIPVQVTAPAEFPVEVQNLMMEMAERINAMSLAGIETQKRLADLEAANRMLAAEAAKRLGVAA